MRRWTVDRAVTVMLANLKGVKKKPSNLIEFAEACRFLKEHPRWGMKKMREFFVVSEYMLRQIDRINDLNAEVKKLVERGEIGIDSSYQLSRLKGKKQVAVAHEVVGMTAMDVREFVDLVLENPTASIQKLKMKFLNTKPRKQKIHILALPLIAETYVELRKLASIRNMVAHDLVLKLVEEYINAKKK